MILNMEIENYNNGDVSNAEINLAINKNLYQITSDFSEISKAKIVVYCVPTPLSTNSKPDLSFITTASRTRPTSRRGTL